MPSLSGIMITETHLGHSGPLIILARHFGPIFCCFGPNSYDISPHPLESLRPRLRPFGPLDFSAVFFKESNALLASTIIFFDDTSCNVKIV